MLNWVTSSLFSINTKLINWLYLLKNPIPLFFWKITTKVVIFAHTLEGFLLGKKIASLQAVIPSVVEGKAKQSVSSNYFLK